MKIYAIIRSIADALMLQETVSMVQGWCLKNGMLLNIDKCLVKTFTRTTSKLIFDYNIEGNILRKTSIVRDLCSRAYQVWGFDKRRAKDFDDIYLTKQ